MSEMPDFAWTPDVRRRVEQRADLLRRRRRRVSRIVGTVVVLAAVSISVVVIRGSDNRSQHVVTSAPTASEELAALLPPAPVAPAVLPELHVKAVKSGLPYGVMTQVELPASAGAGVNRQWVGAASSGPTFLTVIASVVRFDTPAAATAWAQQTRALVKNPTPLIADGADNLYGVRGDLPGGLADHSNYQAGFTLGSRAFALQLLAPSGTSRNTEFLQLLQTWTHQLHTGSQILVGTTIRGWSLLLPDGWTTTTSTSPRTGSDTADGPDGFVGVSAGNAANLDQAASLFADHVLKPYGSHPTITTVEIDGRPARLITPSPDAPTDNRQHLASAHAVVEIPTPIVIGSSSYRFLEIETDANHLASLIQTLRFI